MRSVAISDVSHPTDLAAVRPAARCCTISGIGTEPQRHRRRSRRRAAAVAQRRRTSGRAVGGQDRPHRDLEDAGDGRADGAADQHRRRRSGRPAAHGGEHRAVFVYQIELLPILGAASSAATISRLGQFGENFTVEGLPDDEVCIGDRYRIGEAVFEVTQPRVTCFRSALRMNEPRMPSLLVSHHRPGFYLRVLQEGQVEAGDEIVRLSVGPGGLTSPIPMRCCTCPQVPARRWRGRCGSRRSAKGGGSRFAALLDQASMRADARPASPAWAGFVPLTRDRDPPRKRHDRLVHADAGRRRTGARTAAGPGNT